ncbi:V-type proton ATPase subunit H-like protein [Paramicrosporidium saccamoebae]|uniref:V-type proton ATPase subunit H-like protein n=1 Tax=Paramicrosporidium saccamoebae TaxID=1246581 RepID=A0A2H9TGU8_9FUNG|nr:V-type proton ATPase subunit H-like protein [Paramicrosporidium saccamoebae]
MHPEREQRVLLSSLLLEHLLRVSSIRDAFSRRCDDLKMLATVLIRSRNVQIQYQAIFAIWLLTFDTCTAVKIVTRYGVIQSLLDVAKGAIKEKIIRMCISTWRNLLSKCPTQAVPVMVGAKVLEYLESIAEGKIADEEVSLDVSVLKDELMRAYQSLNSFDEYASELKSGKLEWSPPHKSELFWRDNAPRLAENNLELLKILGRLLEPSNNPQVLAIAAGDIGMYVSFHAVGRQNLDKLGIKQKIMSLISHPDSEVRFQALSSMQKYMVKVWNPA